MSSFARKARRKNIKTFKRDVDYSSLFVRRIPPALAVGSMSKQVSGAGSGDW